MVWKSFGAGVVAIISRFLRLVFCGTDPAEATPERARRRRRGVTAECIWERVECREGDRRVMEGGRGRFSKRKVKKDVVEVRNRKKVSFLDQNRRKAEDG